MRLHELLNEVISADIAKTSLLLAARNLNSALLLSRKYLETDSPQMLIAGELSRWFQKNYLSSRVARNQGLNLQSTLEFLARDNRLKFIKSMLPELHMDRELKISTYKQIQALIDVMSAAIKEIHPKDNTPSVLNNTYNQLLADISDIERANKKPTKAEYVSSVVDKQAKAHSDGISASQRAQAENVVNTMILTLPKDLQNRARQAVAKADNKILALKQFLDNR